MRHGESGTDGPADLVEAMLRNLPGVVYRCESDADWTMQLISDEIEAMTGHPAASFVANAVRSFASIIHPDDRIRVEQEIDRQLADADTFVVEYRLLRVDGGELWVLERGRSAQMGGRRVLDGIIFDITARKRAQAELLASLAEQSAEQALADERIRISRELHDSVGHALSVVVLQAGAAASMLRERSGSVDDAILAIQEVARETLEEMDQLLSLLDPHQPVHRGRRVADVAALVERVRAAGVMVDLEVEGEARGLLPETETTAYRVVQEGLTNAIKHARSTAIEVRLRLDGNPICLRIRNRSTRPTGTAGPARSSRGLSGLRGRVRDLGGDLVVARDDHAFELRVDLPRTPQPVSTRPC